MGKQAEQAKDKELWKQRVELAQNLLKLIVAGQNGEGRTPLPEDQYVVWMKVLAEAPLDVVLGFSQHPEKHGN
ncbi:MAG TPA: hypothetical protein VI703_05635 [Anaerolineales bacterium]|jgi:hypothetical protein|nr:hypothetical protein [Anaerolineales bacterium]